MNRFHFVLMCLLALPALSKAGYEQPSFIDGCQSIDGRFVITAQQVIDPAAGTKGGPPKPSTAHGPFKWKFTWKDNKTGDTKTFDAQGVQAGQIYAQLFMAPDGETFALFNHVIAWCPTKSQGHYASEVLKSETPGKVSPDKRNHEAVSRRLIIYKKDGTIIKEFGISDFLTAEEWDTSLCVFNRVHWLVEYPGLAYKKAPRPSYALCQVSPDYSILELRLTAPRQSKDKGGRIVRVDLTKGVILAADWKSDDKNKIPVRPFVGEAELPAQTPAQREGYVPSLDPVRTPGKLAEVSADR